MADPAPAELARLVRRLRAWLAYQGRLGWPGAPAAPLAATDTPPETPAPPPRRPTLEEIRAEMGDCRRCKLWRTRTHLVFGEGSPTAALMFIGEGPGAEEDLQGRPFVGPAGQLLNNLLAKLGLSREEVYIANVVKSRPPGNREPEPDEIAACLPFLKKQIEAIQPRVIVTLGRVATQALLDTTTPLTKLRGTWQRYQGIPVMPTFHPSYLLRFPRERLKTWEDMQKVMEFLARHE
ncbi:MAG: uracil-DNA glycosylase [Syntrophobacterales bacterium]|nr:uracil-DNA glycosylase [Syntrophobacterales bacterium]